MKRGSVSYRAYSSSYILIVSYSKLVAIANYYNCKTIYCNIIDGSGYPPEVILSMVW